MITKKLSTEANEIKFDTSIDFYSEQAISMLENIADALSDSLDMNHVLITLLENDSFSVMHSKNMDVDKFPCKGSFCELVVNSEAILKVSDTLKDPLFKSHPMVENKPFIRSYIGVPIMDNSKVIGVVCAFHDKQKKFTKKDTMLLQNKANIARLALRSDNLHKRFEMEHRLVSKAPMSSILLESKPGWPAVFVSDNCFSLFEMSIPENKNEFRLDDHIVKEDRVLFKDSLNYHRVLPLNELETHYRIELPNGSQKSIYQVSSSEYNDKGELTFVRIYLIDQTDQKELEARLRSLKERSQLVIDSLELGTWDLNVASGITQVNHRWFEMIGLTFEDQESASDVLRTRIHPLDKKRVELEMKELIEAKRDEINQQYRLKHTDGSWVWVNTFGKTVENIDGKPSRIVGTQRDVTESYSDAIRKQKQDDLVSLMSKAQRVFLQESDLKAACSSIFDELVELAESDFGFVGEKIMSDKGKPALKIQAITDISWDDNSRALYRNYIDGGLVFENLDNLFGRVITSEEKVVSNDVASSEHSSGVPHGHPVMDCFLGLPIKFDGIVYGMIGFANRVVGYDDALIDFLSPLLENLGLLMKVRSIDAARAAAEEELKEMATTDELTELPNRRIFSKKMSQQFKLMKRHETPFCVAIMDIDFFKSINDSLGHDAGDVVLKEISDILSTQKREVDTVCRIGGEEFAVVMPNTSIDDAYLACERIRKAVQNHNLLINNKDIKVTVSTGLADGLLTDADYEETIKRADDFLYLAKNQGRNMTAPAPTLQIKEQTSAEAKLAS